VTYNELTLHYFDTAAAAGVLSGAGVSRGAAGSRAQGTWVQFDVQAAAGTIQAASFLALGCPHTIAMAAWVAEHAVGLAVRPVLPDSLEELNERFAVPVEKRGRLLIIEDAWLAAVRGLLPAALSVGS
jgi:NifU-like protein involved in Fe-S cluster formation